MVIDLHTHSTASDGTDTPAELVANARAAGIDVLAITDHDTTAGWDDAIAARPAGLTLVPGTEFSCVHHTADGRPISLHLLGYLFDPAHDGLRAERARLRESRVGRGRQIVENLAADGIPISWQRVAELADGGAVGRPHIARALVENGVVDTVSAAFTDLLSSSSKYYARKADTGVLSALALIRAAGGVSVFAHPLAMRRGPVVDDDVIAGLAAAGLTGIEIDHPDQTADERRHLTGLAGELGLIGTGSSDYHGTNKTTPLAACTTRPDAYEAMIAQASATEPVHS